MRVTYIVNRIELVGHIWQPGFTCAQVLEPNRHDVANMCERGGGEITRDAVQWWLDTHAGDFSDVLDFSADFGDGEFVSDWQSEESAMAFFDAFYGSED